MPKWIWVVLALLLSSGIYFSIRYGLRPKPIPQLNPTVFENPGQIGVVTYHALRASIRQERVLVIGSTPSINAYPEIWNGFFKAAIADGIKIGLVFQRDDLTQPSALPTAKVKILKTEDVMAPSTIDEIRGSYKRGGLDIVHVRNVESTHLLPNTLTRKLQAPPDVPVVSISMLPMAVREEDIDQVAAGCIEPRSDGVIDRLGCASTRISRRYLRKRLPTDKWVAAIERHGLKEYLLFVSEPHKSGP